MSKKSPVKIVFAAIVVIILFAVFIMPALSGVIIKQRINSWQHQAKLNGTIINIKVNKFHRGWFHSSADISMSFQNYHWMSLIAPQLNQIIKQSGNKYNVPTQPTIHMTLNISQGPFANLWRSKNSHSKAHWWELGHADTTIVLAHPIVNKNLHLPILSMPTHALIQLPWIGGATTTIDLPAMTIYQDDEIKITIDQYQYELKLLSNYSRFIKAGQIKGLQIIYHDTPVLKIDGINDHADFQKLSLSGTKQSIWIGNYHMNIPAITAIDDDKGHKGEELGTITDINLFFHNHIPTDHSFKINLALSAGNIRFAKNNIGSAEFNLAIDFTDVKKVINLYNELYKLIKTYKPTPNINKELLQANHDKILDLVAQSYLGATISMDPLLVKTPEGNIKLSVSMTIPKKMPSAAATDKQTSAGNAKNQLDRLTDNATMRINVSVNKSLFDQGMLIASTFPKVRSIIDEIVGSENKDNTARLKTMLVKSHLLKEDGDNYLLAINCPTSISDTRSCTLNGVSIEMMALAITSERPTVADKDSAPDTTVSNQEQDKQKQAK